MNRDTLTGIIGAVLLVSAMVGVFLYERNVAIAAGIGLEGEDDLATQTFEGPTLSGTTPVGDASNELLVLDTPRTTNVTFTLTWTAQQGSDTLKLTVRPPEGLEAGGVSEPEDDGEITFTVPVPNTPEGDGLLGVGEWKVTVEFVSAQGPAPGPAGSVGADTEVSWELTTSVEAWQAPGQAA